MALNPTNFNKENIVFEPSRKCTYTDKDGKAIQYHRINIKYRNEQQELEPVSVMIPGCITSLRKNEKGELSMSIGLYERSPSEDQQGTIDILEMIQDTVKNHLKLEETKEALGKWDIDDYVDIMSIFWKRKNNVGEEIVGAAPRIFPKLMMSKGKVVSYILDADENDISIDDIVGKSYHGNTDLIVDSIYIGDRPSIQLKLGGTCVLEYKDYEKKDVSLDDFTAENIVFDDPVACTLKDGTQFYRIPIRYHYPDGVEEKLTIRFPEMHSFGAGQSKYNKQISLVLHDSFNGNGDKRSLDAVDAITEKVKAHLRLPLTKASVKKQNMEPDVKKLCPYYQKKDERGRVAPDTSPVLYAKLYTTESGDYNVKFYHDDETTLYETAKVLDQPMNVEPFVTFDHIYVGAKLALQIRVGKVIIKRMANPVKKRSLAPKKDLACSLLKEEIQKEEEVVPKKKIIITRKRTE